ncbi:efflux transporter, outer membrane factor (OMF) lipoprotein, NodT family [Halopseudomonas litoralis]|uniref:Efflux transporter, outer membrane factor (OMF) lipoprotein, NodT family n=1 Tax=Halopseudomonas litoralis TaxID=797277 RepID=A0A1H1REW6_9GAMM|nr:efflux transporter outer membrane subunit [Halopseudomonas litoralis]SDS34317.1 efflux transporter, outer membrane factor (OMF) lipoprotein, NodT family [Halopseudomonas litoralis]
MRSSIVTLSGLTMALVLGACSSVPEHAAPELPTQWFSRSQSESIAPEGLASWWQAFDDPLLASLVTRALQQNHDVELAMLRVASSRAQSRQSRAGLLPSIDLPGSASRQRIENDRDVPPGLLRDLGLDDDIRIETWELALQASWELDLFGATRARSQAAQQQVRSAEAEAIAARLAVAANTAQAYVQLRALQNQRELLTEGIDLAAQLQRIAGLLFDAGEVTRLDVESAAAEHATLQADLSELEINLAQASLALDTLLAQPPGSSARELSAHGTIPLASRPIPAGQPVDLLRRRPDLIAEAARLDATALQSLAARRDLFPTLAVQAALGRSGMALNDQLSSVSNFTRLGATLGLPIFDFGRRRAAIEMADVAGETRYVAYRQSLGDALEQVEQGLTAVDGQRRRLQALQRVLEHYQRTHELAQTSYRLGEANLQDVLNAQRGLLQGRQQRLAGRTALATAQVALFVALGGGWEAKVEEPTTAAR